MIYQISKLRKKSHNELKTSCVTQKLVKTKIGIVTKTGIVFIIKVFIIGCMNIKCLYVKVLPTLNGLNILTPIKRTNNATWYAHAKK